MQNNENKKHEEEEEEEEEKQDKWLACVMRIWFDLVFLAVL